MNTPARSKSRAAARLAAVQALYQHQMESTHLARLLEPFMYEQEVSGWFFHDDKEGLEDMRRWIRRFCP